MAPVPRLWPGLASALAWTIGVTVSLIVGLFALRFVGAGLDHEAALPAGADTVVTVSPTASPMPSVSPSAAPTTTAPPPVVTPQPAHTGADRLLTSIGGNVLAHCVNGQAFLVSWTPAPGFEASNISRGPATTARVTFEASGAEYHVAVTCAGDVPQSTVRRDG
jgi:hypothetical protein